MHGSNFAHAPFATACTWAVSLVGTLQCPDGKLCFSVSRGELLPSLILTLNLSLIPIHTHPLSEGLVHVQVEKILKPGLQPGAADVFLDFLSYSSGPLPEEQLAAVTVPVSMLWGDKDPWCALMAVQASPNLGALHTYGRPPRSCAAQLTCRPCSLLEW